MTPQEREALFVQARQNSTRQESLAEAERTWVEVIAAYRAATAEPARADVRDRQQLARALWRYGMVLAMRGRAGDGLAPAREAVAVFKQVDAALAGANSSVTSPGRDEALSELITAMTDLAELSALVGRPDARLELLDQALGTGLRAAGPPPNAGVRTRRAMATAYHNLAVAQLHSLTRVPSAQQAEQAALSASRAVQLRSDLLSESDPLTGRELANTYLVYARCLTLIMDFDRAEAALQMADRLIDMLRPAPLDLAAELRETARMVAEGRAEVRGRTRRRR